MSSVHKCHITLICERVNANCSDTVRKMLIKGNISRVQAIKMKLSSQASIRLVLITLLTEPMVNNGIIKNDDHSKVNIA